MTLHISAESAMALALAMNDPTYAIEAKRRAAADAIEDLIAFLDDTDGDCDIEENGDEHDSSWPAVGSHAFGSALDEGDEDDDAGEGDGCDEPSLGAPEARSLPVDYFYSQRAMIVQSGPSSSQEHWAQGDTKDLEENVEDEGEATNEDGGDINDEPHDEEQDCCAVDEMGSSYGGMGYEAKQAIDADVRAMLAKVKRKPKDEPSLTIVGPDLRAYRIRIAS